MYSLTVGMSYLLCCTICSHRYSLSTAITRPFAAQWSILRARLSITMWQFLHSTYILTILSPTQQGFLLLRLYSFICSSYRSRFRLYAMRIRKHLMIEVEGVVLIALRMAVRPCYLSNSQSYAMSQMMLQHSMSSCSLVLLTAERCSWDYMKSQLGWAGGCWMKQSRRRQTMWWVKGVGLKPIRWACRQEGRKVVMVCLTADCSSLRSVVSTTDIPRQSPASIDFANKQALMQKLWLNVFLSQSGGSEARIDSCPCPCSADTRQWVCQMRGSAQEEGRQMAEQRQWTKLSSQAWSALNIWQRWGVLSLLRTWWAVWACCSPTTIMYRKAMYLVQKSFSRLKWQQVMLVGPRCYRQRLTITSTKRAVPHSDYSYSSISSSADSKVPSITTYLMIAPSLSSTSPNTLQSAALELMVMRRARKIYSSLNSRPSHRLKLSASLRHSPRCRFLSFSPTAPIIVINL